MDFNNLELQYLNCGKSLLVERPNTDSKITDFIWIGQKKLFNFNFDMLVKIKQLAPNTLKQIYNRLSVDIEWIEKYIINHNDDYISFIDFFFDNYIDELKIFKILQKIKCKIINLTTSNPTNLSNPTNPELLRKIDHMNIFLNFTCKYSPKVPLNLEEIL